MPPISLLIKPASSSCNMRCAYCFYADVAHSRAIPNYGIMSDEILETIVQKVFAYADGFVSFGFQGGEPTLAGLDFFKKTVALQKQYNTKNIRVDNAIQTNGLAMDEEWAAFLHDNHFLVGLSLDGTKPVHDKYRCDAQQKPTFDRVLAAAKLMDRYQVDYNILSTVNADVAANIDKIYYFFKKQHFGYLQFIPCLDEFGNDAHDNLYSLTAAAYGEFLKKLFDLWYVDLFSKTPISVRYFDNLVSMMAGYPPESCGMTGSCSCYYMIEADGSVYPCDFYVTDEWRIGNVRTDSWEEMRDTDTAKRFVSISRQVHEDCKTCPYFMYCRGGCRRNREPISLTENGLNTFCEAYKTFFAYAGEDLMKIAQKIRRGN